MSIGFSKAGVGDAGQGLCPRTPGIYRMGLKAETAVTELIVCQEGAGVARSPPRLCFEPDVGTQVASQQSPIFRVGIASVACIRRPG